MTITNPEITSSTVTARTADVLAAVKAANSAVSKRSTVPVLAGVRLHTSQGTLHVERYDYDTAITKRVKAYATDTTLAPSLVIAASLAQVLALLDQKGNVALHNDGKNLVVTQGSKRVELMLMPVEDFPQLPEVPEGVETTFLTTGAMLKALADGVTPFVGKDDMLPVLTATYLEFDEGVLTAMSTDRFRAAMFTTPVVTTYEGAASTLVRGLATIGTVLANAESLQLVIDDGYVHFVSEATTITKRQQDGEFPRLRRLWPSESRTTASFEPLGFLKSLKFVAAGVDRNEAVGLVVKDNNIAVTSEGDSVAVSDQVPAITTGDIVATGFNPTYLADAVKVFGKGYDVTMSSNEGTKPSVFTSEAIPSLRVLLMPRRMVR